MPDDRLNKYDLHSRAFKAKAYETYAQTRAENPILLQRGMQSPVWYITGYKEAKQVLADDRRFVKDYRNALTPEERSRQRPTSDLFDLLYNNMLSTDKPDHTRLRAIVGKAFTNRRVQSLAPRIQQIADELIDVVQHKGELHSMIALLIVAGHETTANLIGNSILALMQHSEQMAQLLREPTLIDTAVEEFLRYDGVVE
jgi:cytochrome P450 PksS